MTNKKLASFRDKELINKKAIDKLSPKELNRVLKILKGIK